MRRTLMLAAAMLSLGSFAFADIARPDRTPQRTPKPKGVMTQMDIKLDSDATEARLIIPKSQISQLRAQLEQMDDDGNTAAVSGFSRTQTIVSGAFLSLALVFGGMWFVRSGKASSPLAKAAVIAAVVGAISFTATLVYANVGPPAEARQITGKMFSQGVHMYGFGWGEVRLEASSTEKRIQLIVPDPKDPKPANEE